MSNTTELIQAQEDHIERLEDIIIGSHITACDKVRWVYNKNRKCPVDRIPKDTTLLALDLNGCLIAVRSGKDIVWENVVFYCILEHPLRSFR